MPRRYYHIPINKVEILWENLYFLNIMNLLNLQIFLLNQPNFSFLTSVFFYFEASPIRTVSLTLQVVLVNLTTIIHINKSLQNTTDEACTACPVVMPDPLTDLNCNHYDVGLFWSPFAHLIISFQSQMTPITYTSPDILTDSRR